MPVNKSLLTLLYVSVLSLHKNSNPKSDKNFGQLFISPVAILNPPPMHIILKFLFFFVIS